jgi:hypothetical protein
MTAAAVVRISYFARALAATAFKVSDIATTAATVDIVYLLFSVILHIFPVRSIVAVVRRHCNLRVKRYSKWHTRAHCLCVYNNFFFLRTAHTPSESRQVVSGRDNRRRDIAFDFHYIAGCLISAVNDNVL